jgi:hypothetical protein
MLFNNQPHTSFFNALKASLACSFQMKRRTNKLAKVICSTFKLFLAFSSLPQFDEKREKVFPLSTQIMKSFLNVLKLFIKNA